MILSPPHKGRKKGFGLTKKEEEFDVKDASTEVNLCSVTADVRPPSPC